MKDGVLLRWLKEEGQDISEGDAVVEIETMKAVLEVPSPGTGVLGGKAYSVGDTVPVREVMAWVLAPGETAPVSPSRVTGGHLGDAAQGTRATPPAEGGQRPGRRQVLPTARRLAREHGIDLETLVGSGPGGRIVDADVLDALAAPTPAAVEAQEGRPPAEGSSLAQRLAASRGVDLRGLTGTGPGGRVMKADVERARPVRHYETSEDVRVPLTPMRRTIASRMQQSLLETAQLTLHTDVDVDALVDLRGALNEQWASEDLRPTYQDFLIVAVARALRVHPILNSVLEADELRILDAINVGLAVALDEGLVVPVVKQADRLSLREVCARSRELVDQARTGTLAVPDTVEGTFTITSLGGAGVGHFTPILNPPQVGILGVGGIVDATSWRDGSPVMVRRVPLSLTIDHRVVDGAPGAAFLATLAGFISQPFGLLS